MTDRLRFVTGLLLTTLGAAAFAVAFRGSLALFYRSVFGAANVVDAISSLPWWLRIVVPVSGAAVIGVIAHLLPAASQGVSNVMEAVALGNVRLSLRATARRLASSWSAIASGLSIGREGPLIEFGGSLGATIGRVLAVPLDSTRILVAAGAAAGFAAAYNTPFAAVLFVFETMIGVAALEAVLPVMVGAFIATTVTRAAAGGGPIYGQRAFELQSSWGLISFGLLGALAAMMAFAFKKVLAGFERTLDAHPIPQPARAILGGLFVGLVAAFLPGVAGNGYEPLNGILDQRLTLAATAFLLVAKIPATSAAVSSGIPGGVFTPLLLVGGALGSLWAHLLERLGFPAVAAPGSYALVGMAATTAASIHAPMTAVLLAFELSGDYPIVLPLLLATVVATSLSRGLGSQSIYDSELRRRGLRLELTLEGRRVHRE